MGSQIMRGLENQSVDEDFEFGEPYQNDNNENEELLNGDWRPYFLKYISVFIAW
jgi:hypothetical protein